MNQFSKLFFIGMAVTFLISSPIVYADVVSPLKQAKFGIDSQDIVCKQGYVKVSQNSDNQTLCVKPNTAERMHKSNLVIILATPNDLDKAHISQEDQPIGTINILSIAEQKVTPKKFQSTSTSDFFYVSFEICGEVENIRNPEVIIKSDSETKPVKIAERVFSNTCQTNVAKIKAVNSDSITLELLNKGGISKKITQLEDRVNNLKFQLAEEKSKMSSKLNQKENVSDKRITKIVELRKELNQDHHFNQQLAEIADSIIDLRNQILEKSQRFT